MHTASGIAWHNRCENPRTRNKLAAPVTDRIIQVYAIDMDLLLSLAIRHNGATLAAATILQLGSASSDILL